MISYSTFKLLPLLAGALIWTACTPQPDTEPQTPTATPATPTEIEQQIKSSQAPLLMVHLWATWCDPCREEFPELVKTQKIFAPKGVELLLISADSPSDAEQVSSFLAEQNMPSDSLISTELNQRFIEIISPSWAGSLPATFFYQNGKRVNEWEGKRTYEEYAEAIEALLK